MRHFYDKIRLIYHNQSSLQHLLRNKTNIKYFTCDKLKDIFNICVHGFAHLNKLKNRYISPIYAYVLKCAPSV